MQSLPISFNKSRKKENIRLNVETSLSIDEFCGCSLLLTASVFCQKVNSDRNEGDFMIKSCSFQALTLSFRRRIEVKFTSKACF